MDEGTTFCPIIHHLLHGELVPNEDVPILAVGRSAHPRRLKSHDLNTRNRVNISAPSHALLRHERRKFVNSVNIVVSDSKQTSVPPSINVPDSVPKRSLPCDGTQTVVRLKRAHICRRQEQERTALSVVACRELADSKGLNRHISSNLPNLDPRWQLM